MVDSEGPTHSRHCHLNKLPLGPARSLWDELLHRLASDCAISDHEWNTYSAKAGWSLRLKVKKRNIIYLSPHPGAFTASLVLGEKAVEAAHQSALPKRVLKLVDEAKKYPEGKAIRLEVAGSADLDAIVKLSAIKLAH